MNRYFTTLKRFVSDSEIRFGYLSKIGFYNYLDDETFIKKRFRLKFGYEPDLNHPQTFNEKIQWLKLHDRKPVYTTMVDKYAVKDYVADIIGSQYIIPTLGVWERFEDIDFDLLPNQFVLKCTHDSGGLVIVRDKERFDKKAARKKIKSCMTINYFYQGREWPYKNVRPRIIAEKYLEEKQEYGSQLKDYKIFNFNGKARMIQVDIDRFTEHKRNLYRIDWSYIEAAIEFPNAPDRIIEKPEVLDELLELAEKLSKGCQHLRTDFYIVDGKIYFGELTLYHGSGFERFYPFRFGLEAGGWLTLPQIASTEDITNERKQSGCVQ